MGASISMESPRKLFFIHEGTAQYHTMSTFYFTYSRSTACIQERNPAEYVKSGLATVYLALFLVSLSFRASYSAWKKVQRARQLSKGYREQDEDAMSPFLSSSGGLDGNISTDRIINNNRNDDYSRQSLMPY